MLLSSSLMRPGIALLIFFLPVFSSCGQTKEQTEGQAVVRVDDTAGTHCIAATTERITIFVRRVFVEKEGNWFTDDKKAGVLVRSQVSGEKGSGTDDKTSTDVQVPAVNLVSVKSDKKGRTSLALEYPVASGIALKQNNTLTRTLDIDMYLAKARGRNTFGSVLDLAGQSLNQLPIPPNPYSEAGSKILKFANGAIDSSLKENQNDHIAHIGMQFNEGKQTDLAACKSAGNERTGAVAVLRATGLKNADLIPVTDTERLYCFRYSSDSTFELLAAKRNNDGSCPSPQAFSAVPNDYVMLLLSAQPISAGTKSVVSPTEARQEAASRCKLQKLAAVSCGIM
jgi:hypothetical protein